jgi:hypothetical protein
MTYTFYCEDVPHTTRYAFSKKYKTRLGLANCIKRLEAKGHTVEVRFTLFTHPVYVYQDGKFIN